MTHHFSEACECDKKAMDYQDIRAEHGADLGLIAGIDLDILRGNKQEIRRQIEARVSPLLVQGRYVPLADGRVREDIPYEHYVYYRRLLENMIIGS